MIGDKVHMIEGKRAVSKAACTGF